MDETVTLFPTETDPDDGDIITGLFDVSDELSANEMPAGELKVNEVYAEVGEQLNAPLNTIA